MNFNQARLILWYNIYSILRNIADWCQTQESNGLDQKRTKCTANTLHQYNKETTKDNSIQTKTIIEGSVQL